MKKILLIIGSILAGLVVIAGVSFASIYIYSGTKSEETSTTESDSGPVKNIFSGKEKDMGDYQDYTDYDFDVYNLLDDIGETLWYFGDMNEELEYDEDLIHDEFWKDEVLEEIEFAKDLAEEHKTINAPEKYEEVDEILDEAMDNIIEAADIYPEALKNGDNEQYHEVEQNLTETGDLINEGLEKAERIDLNYFQDMYYEDYYTMYEAY